MNPTDRRQWYAIGVIAVLCVFAILIAMLRTPDDPSLAPVADDGYRHYVGGWNSDPDAVAAVQSALPEPWFSDTLAFRAFRGADTGTVIHSDAVKMVLGRHLPARDQGGVGSCVSFGSCSAIEYLMLLQIAAALPQPSPIEYRDLVQEAMYGLSRVEIGGGKIRGDGSVTAWAGEAARKFGVIPRGTHAGVDLNLYSESRCREWGKKGLPDDLEPISRLSPVKGITFAKTAAEVDRAIRQGYTVAVGSQIGFGNSGPYKRDKDGFLKQSGNWGHCMAVIGVRDDRKGFLFLNSWGDDWVSGPTGGMDIPPGSFWVEWRTAEKMFAEGDCVIFSDAVGFPAKDPLDDWLIRALPAPRNVAVSVPMPVKGGDPCDLQLAY
jgi:hypothetical protein